MQTVCKFVGKEKLAKGKAMKTTSYYPVIMTGDVPGTAAFYVEHFGFRPAFESDWYMHLTSAEDETVNLAVLQGDHETIPEQGRGRVSGLLINFEVEDVDAEYGRAGAGGLRRRAGGRRQKQRRDSKQSEPPLVERGHHPPESQNTVSFSR